MLVKPGVQLNGVHYLLWYAAAVVEHIRLSNGLGPATITGGTEDDPDRVGAEHHAGIGLDFRTRDIPPSLRPDFAELVRRALGPTFEVLLEPDHLHIDLYPGTMPGLQAARAAGTRRA